MSEPMPAEMLSGSRIARWLFLSGVSCLLAVDLIHNVLGSTFAFAYLFLIIGVVVVATACTIIGAQFGKYVGTLGGDRADSSRTAETVCMIIGGYLGFSISPFLVKLIDHFGGQFGL